MPAQTTSKNASGEARSLCKPYRHATRQRLADFAKVNHSKPKVERITLKLGRNVLTEYKDAFSTYRDPQEPDSPPSSLDELFASVTTVPQLTDPVWVSNNTVAPDLNLVFGTPPLDNTPRFPVAADYPTYRDILLKYKEPNAVKTELAKINKEIDNQYDIYWKHIEEERKEKFEEDYYRWAETPVFTRNASPSNSTPLPKSPTNPLPSSPTPAP